jgi:hypothetical protein
MPNRNLCISPSRRHETLTRLSRTSALGKSAGRGRDLRVIYPTSGSRLRLFEFPKRLHGSRVSQWGNGLPDDHAAARRRIS